jgi:hypothetical protein
LVWVPIWDYAGGNGRQGCYHIVGFGAIVFTGEDTQHGKWLTGVRASSTYGPGPKVKSQDVVSQGVVLAPDLISSP